MIRDRIRDIEKNTYKGQLAGKAGMKTVALVPLLEKQDWVAGSSSPAEPFNSNETFAILSYAQSEERTITDTTVSGTEHHRYTTGAELSEAVASGDGERLGDYGGEVSEHCDAMYKRREMPPVCSLKNDISV